MQVPGGQGEPGHRWSLCSSPRWSPCSSPVTGRHKTPVSTCILWGSHHLPPASPQPLGVCCELFLPDHWREPKQGAAGTQMGAGPAHPVGLRNPAPRTARQPLQPPATAATVKLRRHQSNRVVPPPKPPRWLQCRTQVTSPRLALSPTLYPLMPSHQLHQEPEEYARVSAVSPAPGARRALTERLLQTPHLQAPCTWGIGSASR